MKKGYIWPLMLWLAVMPAWAVGPGTAFTYQGRLLDGGQPANGEYDLQFALSSTPAEGGYIGPALNVAPVPISNGLFTVTLDFGGGVFDGSALWIEIGVRPNGSADPYTVLTPRQPITAAPYALYAATAGSTSTTAGSGTNTTVYGGLTLAGLTNVVLDATNQAVVTTPPNTNVVVVSGAGDAAANGIYILQGNSPNPLYVNPGGMNLIYLPDDLDYAWEILNSTGTVFYASDSGDLKDAGEWQVISGTEPAPLAVSYGVNLVTNFMTQLTVAGARVPGPSLGNDLYVNGAIGDDLFAQRGRPDLPYRTVYAALQDATTNDRVRVAPGIYHEAAFRMTLPPGLKLIGGGKRVTCIYGPPGLPYAANLDLSSSNVLSGFSTDFIMSLGGYSFTYPAYGGATNVLLENIEASGSGDVVFGNWWHGFRAVNCDFSSRADCFADGQRDDSGTNAVAELYNCRLVGGWHVLASYGRGQIRMFGGSIEATNGDSSACVYAGDSGGAGAAIGLSGVSLRCPPADDGGQPCAILNESFGDCTITVKGMLVRAEDVFGAVNFEGFGLTTNILVLSPDMVTNLLCFTNGILMDVK